MFFIASKLFALVSEPLNFFVLLLLAGIVLLATRFARLGRRILVAATLGLAACCFLPVGSIMLRALEDRFPRPGEDVAAPTGIIVLGGAMEEERSLARDDVSLNDAASRLTTGVALAARYPGARLIFTGGAADIRQRAHDEAQGVRKLWLSLGVPEARMAFEDKSRNTFENAVFTRALLAPKAGETYFLVTSAWHMPRSVGIFRHAGFTVVPYPVDYRTFGDGRDFRPTVDAMGSLERLAPALHEWVGLLAYRLTGKTDRLLPGPADRAP